MQDESTCCLQMDIIKPNCQLLFIKRREVFWSMPDLLSRFVILNEVKDLINWVIKERFFAKAAQEDCFCSSLRLLAYRV